MTPATLPNYNSMLNDEFGQRKFSRVTSPRQFVDEAITEERETSRKFLAVNEQDIDQI